MLTEKNIGCTSRILGCIAMGQLSWTFFFRERVFSSVTYLRPGRAHEGEALLQTLWQLFLWRLETVNCCELIKEEGLKAFGVLKLLYELARWIKKNVWESGGAHIRVRSWKMVRKKKLFTATLGMKSFHNSGMSVKVLVQLNKRQLKYRTRMFHFGRSDFIRSIWLDVSSTILWRNNRIKK